MFLSVLLIIFLYIKPSSTFAISNTVPTVVINNISDSSMVGDSFPVEFTISNAEIGSSYHYKIFGGIDKNTSSLQTFYNSGYLNYTSGWVDFPILVVGDTNPIIVAANGRANNLAGTYNVRVRIAKVSTTSAKYDSDFKTIDIVAPSPTSIPATIVPTQKPTVTPTKIPTLVPTSIPTAVPTDIVYTIEPTIEPTIVNEPEVLSAEVSSVDIISPDKSKSKSNSLGVIFIFIGGLLLLTPLLITKIKSKNTLKN